MNEDRTEVQLAYTSVLRKLQQFREWHVTRAHGGATPAMEPQVMSEVRFLVAAVRREEQQRALRASSR